MSALKAKHMRAWSTLRWNPYALRHMNIPFTPLTFSATRMSSGRYITDVQELYCHEQMPLNTRLPLLKPASVSVPEVCVLSDIIRAIERSRRMPDVDYCGSSTVHHTVHRLLRKYSANFIAIDWSSMQVPLGTVHGTCLLDSVICAPSLDADQNIRFYTDITAGYIYFFCRELYLKSSAIVLADCAPIALSVWHEPDAMLGLVDARRINFLGRSGVYFVHRGLVAFRITGGIPTHVCVFARHHMAERYAPIQYMGVSRHSQLVANICCHAFLQQSAHVVLRSTTPELDDADESVLEKINEHCLSVKNLLCLHKAEICETFDDKVIDDLVSEVDEDCE